MNSQSHELTRRYRVRVLPQILEGVLPLVAQATLFIQTIDSRVDYF